MANTGQKCKLCRQNIPSDKSSVLDNDILKRLEFLQIYLDSNDEDSNVICKQCEEKIKNVFDFKSSVMSSIESYGNNKGDIEDDKFPNEKSLCHLCKKYENPQCLISLTKVLKDDRMMEVFQEHLQKVDLANVENNSMVCAVCQIALTSFCSLIESWLMARYCNNDGLTDDKSNFKMIDVKEEKIDNGYESNVNSLCIFQSVDGVGATNKDCKKRQLGCSDSITGSDISKKIKNDETEENDDALIEALHLKTEEVEIKDDVELLEICTNQGRGEHEAKLNDDKNKAKPFRCYHCSFQTKRKSGLKRHLDLHKSSDRVQMYKCNDCSYETRVKGYLNHHLLKHKSLDEVELYKCEDCPFETKYKAYMKSHLIKHKREDEVEMFKCNECSFETRYKSYWKNHLIKHKSEDEIQTYKCKYCPYIACQSDLKKHTLVHIDPNELDMFKCDICSFETKYKMSLRIHHLKHKSFDEVESYRCEECSFVTKYKKNFRRHALVHVDPSQLPVYKCEQCSFETKRKQTLKTHARRHERVNGIEETSNDEEKSLIVTEKCSNNEEVST